MTPLRYLVFSKVSTSVASYLACKLTPHPENFSWTAVHKSDTVIFVILFDSQWKHLDGVLNEGVMHKILDEIIDGALDGSFNATGNKILSEVPNLLLNIVLGGVKAAQIDGALDVTVSPERNSESINR